MSDSSIAHELREAANHISKIVARLRHAAMRYQQTRNLESLGDIYNTIRQARICLDLASEKADAQSERLIEEIIALPAPEVICNILNKSKSFEKH